MEAPFGYIGTIAASGSGFIGGSIPLVRARTLSLTTRLYCEASLDADPRIDLFYSPDGKNWDSIAFASWTMTFTVSTNIQKTVVFDLPEHGYFMVKVTNTSAADTLTNIKGWYSIQAWPPEPSQSHGNMSTRDLTD